MDTTQTEPQAEAPATNRFGGRRLAVALLAAALGIAVIVMILHWPRADKGLLFAEDFSGETINKDRWATCYFWRDSDCTNEWNDELQVYTDDNVGVEDGRLVLTAEREDAEGYLADGERRNFRYTSGMATTQPGFSFRYGYVEVRAKVPTVQGLWPAIWMMAEDGSHPPEIDVMEHVGEPGRFYSTLHPDSEAAPTTVACDLADLGHGDVWRTFAADWQPDRLTFFVDGEKCGLVDDDVPDKEMYLLFNVAVGGAWAGPPDDDEGLPARMEIDWVRVWEERPSGDEALE